MFRNVVAALNEAQDITLYLKPLTQHFQNLEQSEFPDIVPQLRPLMHCICIVYSESNYYNSTARIIVLMQASKTKLIPVLNKDYTFILLTGNLQFAD